MFHVKQFEDDSRFEPRRGRVLGGSGLGFK